ncbi:hypothetical protein DVR12_25565 [Chitinophaga silvatica]|uniref:Uncharacterized protein n=1 Tax=Chitinophaga silvatica TaxID=2282649 RepID=A0A3E1Y2U5_9BACT|nr:hypothetical protein [Chitinophaga silvatica]RFS18974.1 hypothetical protein DVR12_25565 [Chitinophaga silvatica]
MENFELTPEEGELVASTHFIELKNSAIGKVILLMGELQRALEDWEKTNEFPFEAHWKHLGGKISKGEQYKGLPWVMLDYPRYFSKAEIFAFRTMFWWGHYFIATLHISGGVKEQFHTALEDAYEDLKAGGFQVYVQENPWEHDFENSNYCYIDTLSFKDWKKLISRNDFIKLAKRFEIGQWGELISGVVKAYATLLNTLNGKTGF